MSDAPRLPGPPVGEDVAAGEAPVLWAGSSTPAVEDEVVRRLEEHGSATVRLHPRTPQAMDAEAFRREMERLGRGLPVAAAPEVLDFHCVLRRGEL